MQRARLHAGDGAVLQAHQVRSGVIAFEFAKARLFFQQARGVAHVVVQEDAHRQAQVVQQARVQVVDLLHPGLGELHPALDLLVLDVDQHALDDVAHLLHADGETHDVGPAPALALVQRLARDLGHVVLDVRVQAIDRVVELAQVLRELQVRRADHRVDALQHGLDHVGLVQRLARRAGNGERGRGQGRAVEVARARVGRVDLLARQQALDPSGHRFGKAYAHQRHHGVERQVVEHHQRRIAAHVGPRVKQPGRGERRHDQHADDLEHQVAERHLARLDARAQGGDDGQQPAAQVGAHHQPQAHRDRHAARADQRGRQQHRRQAGIRHDRQDRAHRDLQHDVAGQRGQQGAHRLRTRQFRGRFVDEPQRQQHQPQADEHPPDAPGGGVLARNEQHHADKNEQRREPGQVERRHDAGAQVGAQHHSQRGGQAHQPLADEGRDDERRGRARLHQRRHAHARERGRERRAHAARDELPQAGAEHAQDAGTHQLGAPDQQGHGGQKVQKVFHSGNRALYAGTRIS